MQHVTTWTDQTLAVFLYFLYRHHLYYDKLRELLHFDSIGHGGA